MDFTVNITASPDLLSVLNRIAGVIETLLITPPKTIIVDVITDNANSNNVQEHAQLTSSQAIQQNSHAGTYPSQNTGIS
ncbi:MAG: hypothetical protein Q8858_17395, partial [Bacteroidota bacterium]|nr:hypothetical protein [Bacteroidota bacterium]